MIGCATVQFDSEEGTLTSPDDFAKAILQRTRDKGITVSHLKLQKLMYYCQGYSLAISQEAAFDAKICAWEHGPVVSSVYGHYSMYGSNLIPQDGIDNFFEQLSDSTQSIVDMVLNKLGNMGAWALRNKTHTEPTWLAHYDAKTSTVDKQEITAEEMRSYFEQELISTQDAAFARILDSSDEESIAIPSEINNADDFASWINAQ